MRLTRARAGFTLIDLLVGLVLLGLAGALVSRVLLAHHQAGRRLLQLAAAGLTLDQAAGWMDSELRDLRLADSGGDLLRAATESLSYRARRGSGLACSVGPLEVLVQGSSFSGWRLPQAGRDSLLLFSGGGVPLDPPGTWIAAPITATGTGNCGPTPAIRLGTSLDTSRAPPARLPPLTPILTFEVMQARLYRSQGNWWLGARSESGGEAIQPLAGPLASSGMQLSYRDSTGAAAAGAGSVRELDLRLMTTNPAETALVHLRPRNVTP